LPPGLAIMILVSSVYFVGRAYEEVVNPRLVVQ
jgi:peptide/nickel transport system permease protein